MRFAVVFLALASLQGSADPFYKFPKGTVWKYKLSTQREDAKKDAKVAITLTGEAEGKVTADMQDDREEGKTTKMVWYVSDEVFFWAEQKGDSLSEAMGLYKIGSKKGDTWTVAGGKGVKKATGTNLGTEELQVAAGLYKEAVHTRLESEDGNNTMQLDVFLVENVGVVRMAFQFRKKQMTLELEEFKPAK